MAKKKSPGGGDSRLMRQISVPTEIHLRRMKVRDALDELDRYLGDAAVMGMPWVRVIHGKGAGVLKGAVLEFLSDHPLGREALRGVSQRRQRRRNHRGATVSVRTILLVFSFGHR